MDALTIIDWINLWAFAVAEENAAGGRVVTAPTMGSAGVIPAVMRYYDRFGCKESPYSRETGVSEFLLTASATASRFSVTSRTADRVFEFTISVLDSFCKTRKV